MANGLVRHGRPAVVPDAAASDQAVNKGQLDTAIATRAASSHTHAAADVNSGQLASARMPAVMNEVQATTGVTGTVSTDASTVGNFRDITMTGNITIAVPTNPTNHQVLHYTCLASGATRTVTLNASIIVAPGLTFPLSVPSGKVGRFALEYVSLLSAWVATAAFVSP